MTMRLVVLLKIKPPPALLIQGWELTATHKKAPPDGQGFDDMMYV